MIQLPKTTLRTRGMTYVELIVVLAIFSVISAVVVFNYGAFQSKVDVRSLASDIALKIVEAQKSSLAGKLPPAGYVPLANWKPSYGVYFNSATTADTDTIIFNKKFLYFVDLNQDKVRGGNTACTAVAGNECLEKILIPKGNTISLIQTFVGSTPTTRTDLTATFSRVDSDVKFSSGGALLSNISYVEITITSPKGSSAKVRLYTYGRIQIN